jgi:membrane-associated phospholipid phosphatase
MIFVVGRTRALGSWAIIIAILFSPAVLHAQGNVKRLSDWLLEQPTAPSDYLLGLSWRVPEEIPAQQARQLSLLKTLSGSDRDVKAHPEAVGRMRTFIRSLPSTGRVTVALPDARWLQANPSRDPILLPGHVVTLPRRPQSITVVSQSGVLCQVNHLSGREVKEYLDACREVGESAPDWAWIAQPDGRVQRFGVALWNRETQAELAPGAWVWAPPRNSGWPERFSERLIGFLATQGPAPDVVSAALAGSEGAGKTMLGEMTGGGGLSSRSLPRDGNGSKSATSSLPLQFVDEAGRTRPQIDRFGAQVLNLPEDAESGSRSLEVSSGDWGSVGLLQTPTARMFEAGRLTFSASRAYPYTHGNVFVQPFDWLEAGFRYTNISNRLYGPADLSGSQTFKDKSVDFKIRLLNESAYLPQIAVGVRDLTGTGLFSGEYLVANKRTGSFDWSLGLGWGNVGGRGDLRNPLGKYFPSFNTRQASTTSGGFTLGSYFRGPTALFGGVQYQSPWAPLTLKLEYDGNNYLNEPQGNNQPQRSAWNVGLVYRLSQSVDLNLGFERGNTAMVGFALHAPLDRLYMPKTNDPQRIPVASIRPQSEPDWSLTSLDIKRQTEWHVERIEKRDREIFVTLNEAAAVYRGERVDRVVSVLHRDAPSDIDRFTLTYRENGINVADTRIDRDAWVEQKNRTLPPHAERYPIIARAPAISDGAPLYSSALPRFESGLGSNYQQNLGGPDGFVLYQIAAVEKFKFRFRDDTWLQGSLQLGLVDNYDKFKYTAPSSLPRVRTFLREYRTASAVTMPDLQLTHVGSLGANQYYSLYGGYLEYMYAGAGAEWLYRPFGSRTALGIDVNQVKQRDFRQNFGFDDAGTQTGYSTLTGHATLYWDTGWNGVSAVLSAGRYLAKDLGGTVQIEKKFQNGVSVGGWVSITNLSSTQFGEGSFDKGLYVSIPFDAFLTRSSNSVGHFVWQPLIRDGAAKLGRQFSLYDFTSSRDDRALRIQSAPPPNESRIPADRRDAWQPSPVGPEPFTRNVPRPMAAQWGSDSARFVQEVEEALNRQGFRDLKVTFDLSHRLTVRASNETLRPISRAVGRAARTALRLAPLDAREIRVEFTEKNHLKISYDFVDLPRLNKYFNGRLTASEIADFISVDVLDPSVRQDDPLARLDDLEIEATPRRLVEVLTPDMGVVKRVGRDFANAGRLAVGMDWISAGLLGSGLVLASSLADKRADQFAKDYADRRWLKGTNQIGNALPWVAIGGAAAAALGSSDPVLSRTGYAATEAGGTAFLAVTGLKYLVGRARPENNLGPNQFKSFSNVVGFDSFPSGHTIISWAVVTPFAEEYNAPWLYGVAAVTNLARVGSRQHWVSDTVAGSVLGYGIGHMFWQAGKETAKNKPRVAIGPRSVGLAWAF